MAVEKFGSEVEFGPGPVEKVIHDVEHALHIADEQHSHVAPLIFFGVIALLGSVALFYRLAFG